MPAHLPCYTINGQRMFKKSSMKENNKSRHLTLNISFFFVLGAILLKSHNHSCTIIKSLNLFQTGQVNFNFSVHDMKSQKALSTSFKDAKNTPESQKRLLSLILQICI